MTWLACHVVIQMSGTQSKDELADKNKVIIAGSRSFENYIPLVDASVSEYVAGVINESGFRVETAVSGTARGADRAGEQWAEMAGVPVIEMPADWDARGRQAGPIRNKEMAEVADQAIILWDGESSGSESMIQIARDELDAENVHVHLFKEDDPLGSQDGDDDDDGDGPSGDEPDGRAEQVTLVDSVQELDGVGPVLGGRLHRAGISKVQHVVHRGVDSLTSVEGVGETKAKRLVGQAQAVQHRAEEQRPDDVGPKHDRPDGWVGKLGVLFGSVGQGQYKQWPANIEQNPDRMVGDALEYFGLTVDDESVIGYQQVRRNTDFGANGGGAVRNWVDRLQSSPNKPDVGRKLFRTPWDKYRDWCADLDNRSREERPSTRERTPLTELPDRFDIQTASDVESWMPAAERDFELLEWADEVVVPVAGPYTEMFLDRASEVGTPVHVWFEIDEYGNLVPWSQSPDVSDAEQTTIGEHETVANQGVLVRCKCGVTAILDDENDKTECANCEQRLDTETCAENLGQPAGSDVADDENALEIGVTTRDEHWPDGDETGGRGAGRMEDRYN